MASKPRRAADLRVPQPGNEVEFEVVSGEAVYKLEVLNGYLAGDLILDLLTRPERPGLFSNALHDHLCKIGERAAEVIGMLRRLRVLCGDDSPRRVESLGWRGDGNQTEAEKRLRRVCGGVTEAEQMAIVHAAEDVRLRVMEARKANARSPKGCPKCGGTTHECRLNGQSKWMPGKPAPARCCNTCYTITPNKVVELVPTPGDWQN